MAKMTSAASPDEYIAGISGWQRELVEKLRAAVRAAGDIEETVKWGNLVYESNGPLLLIRAEEQRVLLGFWRGKRLQKIEPQLEASFDIGVPRRLDRRPTLPRPSAVDR